MHRFPFRFPLKSGILHCGNASVFEGPTLRLMLHIVGWHTCEHNRKEVDQKRGFSNLQSRMKHADRPTTAIIPVIGLGRLLWIASRGHRKSNPIQYVTLMKGCAGGGRGRVPELHLLCMVSVVRSCGGSLCVVLL